MKPKKVDYEKCDGCGWEKEIVYTTETGQMFCETCVKVGIEGWKVKEGKL